MSFTYTRRCTGSVQAVIFDNAGTLAEQSLIPDTTVCASDVAHGRPRPDMCLKAALDLEIGCVQGCINVDDSAPGSEAGLASGMWTVGLACSGNEVGMAYDDWMTLPADLPSRRPRKKLTVHKAQVPKRKAPRRPITPASSRPMPTPKSRPHRTNCL